MIHVNASSLQFHLQNDSLSYIFHVLKNGHIGHLYFGKRLHHVEDFSSFYQEDERGATAYVYEGNNQFSLDLVQQEYPVYGTTDFRYPALHIEQEDGSRISDFKYQSYRIMKGKPALQGLPATYVEDEQEAETLEITLYDEVTNAQLRLLYTVFTDYGVITRSASISNHGNKPLNINHMLSCSLDFFDANYEMVQLSGSWSRERHVKCRALQSGVQSISSTRGTSSSQHNPFFALKRPETTEDTGDVYGFNLVYSGNFLAQVEVDHYDVARASIGINPFDFSWTLEEGESFQAPEAVLVYSDQGLNGMSQQYHGLYRHRLARGMWRNKPRPILINNWEATYFDFNEDKILHIATEAKALGIELFVLDDGWFGQRNDDKTSLGDWFENKNKLPNGLKGLSEKINQLGMQFGLWFEPEMVSKVSELYETHPEWVIQVANRACSHGRNQYVLDFSRPEVVNYIDEKMAHILQDCSIHYVKWDMNRYMTEIGSLALPAHRQKEVPHRYILGVYELYERLTTRFPHILFESCASGGARYDPGMLYYAPQTWTSDDTDAVERLKIQYGTSMVYPLSSLGAHVSEVPNHQVMRVTPLSTRANVAFFGTFGYELDVSKMNEQEKQQVKAQIAFYKQCRSLIHDGVFYRLRSPFEGDGNETAWMVVLPDQSMALVGHYQVLAKPNDGFKRLCLRGLDKDQRYSVQQLDSYLKNKSNVEHHHYGDELMYAGLNLGISFSGTNPGLVEDSGDFCSKLWVLQKG
ncbi:alpha-galactosidase [Longirhabdus pacifica]|uniref:alpha-galactosidase n=1 Tax=Longirhabdus pacifica TaxID=2305227 RepID=UPI001008781F|nr:alpha-galactosidase [Longirhabdus pacifica]